MQDDKDVNEAQYEFPLSSALDWKARRIGQAQVPVIVIDSVLQRPAELVDYAAKEVSFDQGDNGNGGYPGIRAPAPLNYVSALVHAVDPLIRSIYALANVELANAECSFSIVTTPAYALHPLQCVPHIDTTYPLQFAILHFLCSDQYGGTAFYRQNLTQFEAVPENREAEYEAAKKLAAYRSGRIRKYVDFGDADYTQIDAFNAAFDRLLIYPSCLLHSGIIRDEKPLKADPLNGRLTANIFVTYVQK
jgi:Family of unknown function (DUF6445)